MNVSSNTFQGENFIINVKYVGSGGKEEDLTVLFSFRWIYSFLLFIDATAWGINVYLDLMSHQKHGIHSYLAAAELNEAWQFL